MSGTSELGLQLIVSALLDLGNVPQLEGVAYYHNSFGAVEEWQGGGDVALARCSSMYGGDASKWQTSVSNRVCSL